MKLIAADMDGTFLDEKGSYDRVRFEHILKRLEEDERHFVVASGNNMSRLRLIFEGLMDRLDFVAENGALVISQGKVLVRKSLAFEDVQAFLSYFDGKLADYCVILSGQEFSYMLKDAHMEISNDMITPEQAEEFLRNIKRLDHFGQIPTGDSIQKITMLHSEGDDHDIIAAFNQNFKGNLRAIPSGNGAIDFLQNGIHKAWGIQQLLSYYGLDRSQLMAFGDGGNDIEMLQLAEMSYAMENAAPSVKIAARYLAPSHREAGVMAVIENYLNSAAISKNKG
ncbi:Cof-type HAD-IIB family hydrolase [Streptococcus dentiloxodontae]